MKTPTTIRLSQTTLELLDNIQRSEGLNKTQVIEIAIKKYALKSNRKQHPLYKFAGAWEKVNLKSFLKDIKDSKVNKDFSL